MPDSAPLPAPKPRYRAAKSLLWQDLGTALLPVIACFLGGATQKWAEGLVVMMLGLLLVAWPPRHSLGKGVNIVLVALIALAATAFLPAGWFFQPEWRTALVNDFGIPIAGTLSPQPWVSAGALLSFLAGLCWLYYVAAQDTEHRDVREQLRIFALGVVLLAGLAIALRYAGTTLPFWQNQFGFGPFPNRNQFANLLGITSVIILACGHDDLRKGRKRAVIWIAALAVVIAAIVLNFSRAGMAILVLGAVLWIALLMLRGGSAARIAVGASVLLVLLAVVLLFGGRTLERFGLRGSAGEVVTSDFRWLIFQDAWQLIGASPWVGIGLGNFQPVFAVFRDASLHQSRALHPESDWLWLWAEMGWPAVVLVIAGAVLLLRRLFPLTDGTNRRFRLAALVAAILFGLHAIVDVSGHRVGSAYAGVFLLGMALRRPDEEVPVRWLGVFFRVAGGLLVVLGATWVLAAYGGMSLPGSVGADHEKRQARTANVGRRAADTVAHATRGLQWAPLDWELYFLRALGHVAAGKGDEAVEDFRRARFLEPNSYEVPYQEGTAWLLKHPTLAVTAWREALRRAGPERPQLYDRMLSAAQSHNPSVRQMLERFATTQPELALAYLSRAQREDFRSGLEKLLQHDEQLASLSSEQKEQLFTLWRERGDLAHLVAHVEANQQLLSSAWRAVAEHRAAIGDHRGAVELVLQHAQCPAIPHVITTDSIEQLQRRSITSPNDYEAALALINQQLQLGSFDEALITLRRVTEQPDTPAYFHFLQMQAWAKQGSWDRAWNAWQAFHARR
jgi:O-antigen ligase/tetratricopeptide (TPR) repeat protein